MDASQQLDTVTETAAEVVSAKPAWLTGGSRKGIPNKNTQALRNIARTLAEARSDEFLQWLDRVAEKRPDRAVTAYLKLLEILAPRTSSGFQVEAATATNSEGHAVTALRLRSLLEAPP